MDKLLWMENYGMFLPVTRYAEGMNKGLYFNDKERSPDIYETFYYLEDESTTYLAYKTGKFFFNKTQCFLELGGNEEELRDYLSAFYKHMNGEWPADLMMTPVEAAMTYEINDYDADVIPLQFDEDRMETPVDMMPKTKQYVGYITGLYANEDYLDQLICLLGKKHGLDIIVLTHT